MNIIEAANQIMESDTKKKAVSGDGFWLLVDRNGYLVNSSGDSFEFHLADIVSEKWGVVDE